MPAPGIKFCIKMGSGLPNLENPCFGNAVRRDHNEHKADTKDTTSDCANNLACKKNIRVPPGKINRIQYSPELSFLSRRDNWFVAKKHIKQRSIGTFGGESVLISIL